MRRRTGVARRVRSLLIARTSIRRVLLLLPTTQIGGMETHCVELARELTRRGLAVAAVIPDSEDLEPLAARFQAAGAHVRRLDLDARRGRRAQARRWPLLVQTIRAWRPDVVHVHTGGPSGGVSLIAAARCATSATVILTEHDVPSDSLPRRQRIFRPWMDRWVHALVAVSRRNAELRADRLGAPAQRFAVVLNGVPVREAASDIRSGNRLAVRSQYGIDPAAVVIGSVVRLVEGKGLRDLLRAFATVGREATSELLLVGEGPLRADLERLSSSLGIRDKVHLVGQHDDPYPLLDAMDMFVLAVPAGSMSIALLEAMSRGLPPVITFCGPEEAVIPEETGLAAPPNDPEGLARVLLRGTQDAALRSRLATAAAAHVRRHFSVQRVADDLLDIYTQARTGAVPSRLRFDPPPTQEKRLKQGAHPDPLDPHQPRPYPTTWSARHQRAYASAEMQAYRAGLLLAGHADVRGSVLDDLSTYFGLSPEECVRRCIDWEQWSTQEWHAKQRDSSESLTEFYRTTRSWAFDLAWYAYLQSEGFHYPVSVVIARALPASLRARGGRHLDFGSGIGDAGQLFGRLGFETELADISTSLLEFARFRLERRGECAGYLDLNGADLGEERYDVITAIDTLVHVPDLPATASMLHRALKPGGYLFTNFDVRPPTPENAWHLYQDDLPLYWQLQRTGFEPLQNLDRRIVCYRRVERAGLAYQLRGVRDTVLLRSPLRPAYRSFRGVLASLRETIRPRT